MISRDLIPIEIEEIPSIVHFNAKLNRLGTKIDFRNRLGIIPRIHYELGTKITILPLINCIYFESDYYMPRLGLR